VNDQHKSQGQLLGELHDLRTQLAMLEDAANGHAGVMTALREEKQQFTHALETIADGVVLYDMDGRVIFVNPAAQTILGAARDEIVGRTFDDPAWQISLVDGRPVPAREAIVPHTLKTAEVRYAAERLAIRPDGTEIVISMNTAPLRDAAGNMVGVIVSFTDITRPKRLEEELRRARVELEDRVRERTEHLVGANQALAAEVSERRRAEVALRESEERFRSLAEGMPHCVWVRDSRGRSLYQNSVWYEYTGTSPGSGQGQDWLDLYHPDDRPHVLAEWTEALRTDGSHVYEVEARMRRHDGEYRWFRVKGSVIRDTRGNIVRWVGTCTDIHEQRRLLDALRDQDRRKDEFLATLAHELRNPLAPICNSLQILKMQQVDVATTDRARELMERQLHHLVRLVDDLLDVSRVLRGKIELRLERVELATVIARAVETTQPLYDTLGHTLTISVPRESLPLEADPVRLTQVLANLLANAAKYTGRGGRVCVTAWREAHEAILRVGDTGIGIAPEMLSRIFELFVQADSATTKSQGGLGIGLTLVRTLVEMHNGTIEARSGGLGKGSDFVVRLPLSAQQLDEPKEREDIREPSGGPLLRSRVLVVDDNRDAAESLALLLRLQSHEVHVAHSGPAALKVAESEQLDIVFLDIGMPGMDGNEVARRLRQSPGLEGLVLVAVTGWGTPVDRRRTAEAGFNHHLVKPVEAKVLVNFLRELKQQTR
jgi:two-component system CheB/CheR fusion protein